MALGALFVGLFLLFQHVVGSTYLFFRGPGDVTTLQCNVPTGAGNKVTLCSSSDPGSGMGEIKCQHPKNEKPCDENIGPQGRKGYSEPECTKCKLHDDQTESLTFAVKTINSMVFTFMVQDSTEGGALECPSWLTLSQSGCENHDLFFVITQDANISSIEENSLSLTVSEGENVTLPCQFQNRKLLAFNLFWFRSGNVNKCLHSVSIDSQGPYSNPLCCVDRESSQIISNQSSHNPLVSRQSHNLTIHSAGLVDTGRYLCAVHSQDSGKSVWKIAANISLVTEPSAEISDSATSNSSETSNITYTNTQTQVNSVMSSGKSSDTPTSTFGISLVTSSITHNPAITVNVAIVCLIVLICIVGIVCIIGVVCRRKRQSAKGSSAPGPRAGDVQLTQVAECFPYSVVPRKDQSDDNEPVAYSVTRVPTPSSQPRPGEGMESTGPNIDSTEHVYCLIEESMVKGDDGKTEIQAVKCSDRTDHIPQVETSLAIELKPDGQSQPKEDSKEDPVALSNEQTYSLIGCPGTGSPGDTETRSRLEEDDPQPGPLEMEENPIYAKIEEA
uniref:uncharacterized protein isoform X2 n=1 Tax=Pristiophorus japonicus TaxID=55135 RepID=UPI00398F216C